MLEVIRKFFVRGSIQLSRHHKSEGYYDGTFLAEAMGHSVWHCHSRCLRADTRYDCHGQWQSNLDTGLSTTGALYTLDYWTTTQPGRSAGRRYCFDRSCQSL